MVKITTHGFEANDLGSLVYGANSDEPIEHDRYDSGSYMPLGNNGENGNRFDEQIIPLEDRVDHIEQDYQNNSNDNDFHQMYQALIMEKDTKHEKAITEYEKKIRDLENQLKTMETKLKKSETIDKMTGLHNKQFFYSTLESQLNNAARQNYSIAVVNIDGDGFKKFNDTFGHAEGDNLIKYFADIIKGVTKRNTDSVARFGGDEYSVILSGTDVEGAITWGNKLMRAFKDNPYTLPNGKEYKISASVGIAVYSSECCRKLNPESAYKNSDRLLYSAKENGRAKFCLMKYN